MRRYVAVLKHSGRGLAAAAALAGMSVGFWWYSPSLGLIVPCGIVFGALAWTHLRGS